MRKQVEALEHHAHPPPDSFQRTRLIGQFHPLDDHPATVMADKAIDATD
jgi:hypothetical protein